MAYLVESSKIIKLFKREQAGLEGQYTKTYIIVDNGKVKIVETYFGDPSGSKTLQYVHVYAPTEIKLGYLDKDWNFIPVTLDEIPKDKELVIGYSVSSGQRIRWF
jgi:hypothetical protein